MMRGRQGGPLVLLVKSLLLHALMDSREGKNLSRTSTATHTMAYLEGAHNVHVLHSVHSP